MRFVVNVRLSLRSFAVFSPAVSILVSQKIRKSVANGITGSGRVLVRYAAMGAAHRTPAPVMDAPAGACTLRRVCTIVSHQGYKQGYGAAAGDWRQHTGPHQRARYRRHLPHRALCPPATIYQQAATPHAKHDRHLPAYRRASRGAPGPQKTNRDRDGHTSRQLRRQPHLHPFLRPPQQPAHLCRQHGRRYVPQRFGVGLLRGRDRNCVAGQ